MSHNKPADKKVKSFQLCPISKNFTTNKKITWDYKHPPQVPPMILSNKNITKMVNQNLTIIL